MSLFDSVKGLIGPEIIKKASTTLGENTSNVSTAVSQIIPGIMGKIISSGSDKGVVSALQSASTQSDSILSDISNIFSGKQSGQSKNAGSSLVSSLFGSGLSDFTKQISQQSGISQSSAGKLISMVAPVIVGVLTKKGTSGGGFDIAKLLVSLGSEKNKILSNLPGEITSLLDGAAGGGILGKIKGLF